MHCIHKMYNISDVMNSHCYSEHAIHISHDLNNNKLDFLILRKQQFHVYENEIQYTPLLFIFQFRNILYADYYVCIQQIILH